MIKFLGDSTHKLQNWNLSQQELVVFLINQLSPNQNKQNITVYCSGPRFTAVLYIHFQTNFLSDKRVQHAIYFNILIVWTK